MKVRDRLRRPSAPQRLRDTEPDDAEVFAEWGAFRLTVARTQEFVGDDDVAETGDVKLLGMLALELEHVVATSALSAFIQTIYLPDPVMDQLCRYWLNLRADESDEREEA
jgi:hypothetical protein